MKKSDIVQQWTAADPFLDIAYFARNPRRCYRMRLATPTECEVAGILSDAFGPTLDRDDQLWIIVHYVFGRLERCPVYAPMPPAAIDITDIPEELAAEIFHDMINQAQGR
jgi:hypothetical protein